MATSKSLSTDSSSRLRADTLASSVVILLVVTVVQRTVGFGRGVLFCRWLSPETLGQWEMAYSFLLLAAPLAVLGVPGSFGRYLEHYRQRGHLRTFLRRTTAWSALFGMITVALVLWNAPLLSRKLFGSEGHVDLVFGLALCLAAVIFHHTLTSLLTALRLFRLASVMSFLQSLIFAGLALGLLTFDARVSSIVIGYGIACLITSLGTIAWIRPGLRDLERPHDQLPQIDFWPRLLRFAFFVWVTNLLSHLFAIADRYMIVNYSGMDSIAALQQVGHYHSSRIVPLLLLSVADLLGGMIMPHLSHDWEAGRQERVGKQVNLSLKLAGLGMLAFGVCVLFFSPLLFKVVLAGKYADGLSVLPWTLVACVWSGIYLIAQNYLWCAERTRLATFPLALGLVLNIGLNLLLLPMWGLFGAVVATAVSTLTSLVAILLLSRRHGMALDRGTWLIVATPMALAAGPSTAAVTTMLLLGASLGTNLVLNVEERAQLRDLMIHFLGKLKPWLRRAPTTARIG